MSKPWFLRTRSAHRQYFRKQSPVFKGLFFLFFALLLFVSATVLKFVLKAPAALDLFILAVVALFVVVFIKALTQFYAAVNSKKSVKVK